MSAVDKAVIHMMCAKERAKSSIKEKLIGDERGAFGIIEIIIIIAIVLVIAFFFRDKIGDFVQNLWKDNVEQNNTGVSPIKPT